MHGWQKSRWGREGPSLWQFGLSFAQCLPQQQWLPCSLQTVAERGQAASLSPLAGSAGGGSAHTRSCAQGSPALALQTCAALVPSAGVQLRSCQRSQWWMARRWPETFVRMGIRMSHLHHRGALGCHLSWAMEFLQVQLSMFSPWNTACLPLSASGSPGMYLWMMYLFMPVFIT